MHGGGRGVGGDAALVGGAAPLGGGGGGHGEPLVREDVVRLHHLHDVAVAVVEPTDVLQGWGARCKAGEEGAGDENEVQAAPAAPPSAPAAGQSC